MDTETTEKKPKKSMKRWENWCRVPGHPAECSCTHPDPSEIIPMRGAEPGSRPMPKDR